MRSRSNAYFRMGAAVAVSEMFGSGRLGDGRRAAEDARRFLASFGVRGMADVDALGIKGPYAADLARIYEI